MVEIEKSKDQESRIKRDRIHNERNGGNKNVAKRLFFGFIWNEKTEKLETKKRELSKTIQKPETKREKKYQLIDQSIN